MYLQLLKIDKDKTLTCELCFKDHPCSKSVLCVRCVSMQVVFQIFISTQVVETEEDEETEEGWRQRKCGRRGRVKPEEVWRKRKGEARGRVEEEVITINMYCEVLILNKYD